jgi:hypothetical protein
MIFSGINSVDAQNKTKLKVKYCESPNGLKELSANLTGEVENKMLGVADASIDFVLKGVSIGTAITDNNGLASFVISNDSILPAKGKVKVNAKFAGNEQFKATESKSATINVTKKTTIKLQYFTNPDENYLEVLVKGKIPAGNCKEKYQSIGNVPITIVALTDTNEILLSEFQTPKVGPGKFIIPKDVNLPLNSEGKFLIEARFNGASQLKKKTAGVEHNPTRLELQLNTIDSVNKAIILAFFIDSSFSEVPLSGVDVELRVKRMHGELTLKKVNLENGKAEITFPDDIPGTRERNLLVIARIVDNDDFGNVMVSEEVKWGIPLKVNESNESIDNSKFSYIFFWFISVIVTFIVVVVFLRVLKK